MKITIIPALKWVGGENGCLEIIDQRKLPGEFIKIKITEVELLYDTIKTLAVRGAPAIGVAAGFGIVLALQKLDNSSSTKQIKECIEKNCKYLASSRPTAVNLFWALQRVENSAKKFAISNPAAKTEQIKKCVFDEAMKIYQEDVDMCQNIGQNGEKFIPDGGAVLTHCNAGALATAGQGTALSVIYEAHKKGKKFKVYSDETRPLLQGARLTMWELQQAGIDATLICDNMAGVLMKQGKINMVIVGADRISSNGDTANKIGTYSLAVLAKANNVPFYIAAPISTFDMNIKDGSQIPIEERAADEVRSFGAITVAPKDAAVYNPAFDVTEAQLITAIITDRGIIESPNIKSISKFMEKQAND